MDRSKSVTRSMTGIKQVSCSVSYTDYDKKIAISKVKYGITILKLGSKGKTRPRRFYLLENNCHILQWISPNKSSSQSRVLLHQIWKIECNQNSNNFRKKPNKSARNRSASISYGNMTLDLIFASENEMFL